MAPPIPLDGTRSTIRTALHIVVPPLYMHKSPRQHGLRLFASWFHGTSIGSHLMIIPSSQPRRRRRLILSAANKRRRHRLLRRCHACHGFFFWLGGVGNQRTRDLIGRRQDGVGGIFPVTIGLYLPSSLFRHDFSHIERHMATKIYYAHGACLTLACTCSLLLVSIYARDPTLFEDSLGNRERDASHVNKSSHRKTIAIQHGRNCRTYTYTHTYTYTPPTFCLDNVFTPTYAQASTSAFG
jgi:hypothetical protein